MRLTSNTIAILTNLTRKHFGDTAEVRLFGSRTNDSLRGGDIDIQIVAPNSTFRDEVLFLVDVESLLDERVDLRVQRGEPLMIDKIAFNEGILLNGL